MIKEKILAKALENAVFDGWNSAMLTHSAIAAGCAKNEAYIHFPRGISDLIDFFAEQKLGELRESAKTMREEKLTGKIIWLIMEYLKLNTKNQEAVKKLAGYYALNPTQGLKNLAALADEIWRLAGDKSADFSYYTKRFSLAAIYSQTLLFWLSDDSEDFAATQGFLERRVADLMSFQKIKSEIKSVLSNGYAS